jgi:hypothetical protein
MYKYNKNFDYEKIYKIYCEPGMEWFKNEFEKMIEKIVINEKVDTSKIASPEMAYATSQYMHVEYSTYSEYVLLAILRILKNKNK